jgi:carboxylesterase type B
VPWLPPRWPAFAPGTGPPDNGTRLYCGVRLGATHGSELVPLFAHPEGIAALPPGLTGRDAAMSDDMQAAWVAFATSGDPGDGREPYDEGGRIAVLDQPLELVGEIRAGRCAVVDRLTT